MTCIVVLNEDIDTCKEKRIEDKILIKYWYIVIYRWKNIDLSITKHVFLISIFLRNSSLHFDYRSRWEIPDLQEERLKFFVLIIYLLVDAKEINRCCTRSRKLNFEAKINSSFFLLLFLFLFCKLRARTNISQFILTTSTAKAFVRCFVARLE